MSVEVARYYESLNVLSILPIELPCTMNAFGIITREGGGCARSGSRRRGLRVGR